MYGAGSTNSLQALNTLLYNSLHFASASSFTLAGQDSGDKALLQAIETTSFAMT